MSQQNSSSWDLGRFVKTLSYFGAIPFLSSIDWFQQWLGSRPDPKIDRSAISYGTSTGSASSFLTDPKLGSILVVGASGNLGQQVVQQLVDQGYRVRSLFTPTEEVPTPSQNQIEPVQADLDDPKAVSEILTGVSAIICADEVNRSLTHLINAADSLNRPGQLIFDFTNPTSDLKEVWGALDDVVMGGVSQSSIRLGVDGAAFSGTVSTANSGGFVSIRTRNFEPPLDLSQAEGIELCVKGDGNRYKLLLRSESGWDSLAYSYSFDTVPNAQMLIRVPFAALVPVFRAKTVQGAQPFDSSQVYAFQLMLSKFEYDGALNPHFSPGAFQLQVKFIKTYRAADLPQFVLVSPAEAPHADEESLRQSGIAYAIVRPATLTDETGRRSLLFTPNIPDQDSKISRENVASVCVNALSHPQARNVTFSVTEAQGNCAPHEWDCLFSQLLTW
ncbi:MAG: NAD(P)H-binding protein [Leptolyngbyaceae cyanobacterium RM1_406_9]|nr:NAD(P)H-binding protein [Leptolyngbyaceae cyanobacterium RM1_406_9]